MSAMKLHRNLVGIFFCLLCGMSCGDVGWQLPNKNFSEADIRKELNQALQIVDQPTFQGWRPELIKQAVPRMYIGLVELWLQFQNLQKEQEEAWRKVKRMTRTSAGSCQELKENVTELFTRVPARMDIIENQMALVQKKLETMEEALKPEPANQTSVEPVESGNQTEVNQTISEPPAHRTCSSKTCRNNIKGGRKVKVSNSQLANKVAALAELLNGHNELLEELYQRVTGLEAARNTGQVSAKPKEGSGGGH
ncbi:PREDICTED: uncharacterized protein LOC108788744 [Nanorana parkeri]|uniref:uncharacterized protein LOC108788744 n=1 Tax=Nanorana parkeri TaxID=125878 RepID=UPI0008546BF2|nr:PREDICTED: uncharacterized protein LOC108788744 [Nanorana parkeri]